MNVFNSDRYGFCVMGGKIIAMDAEDRGMETRVWMEDRLGIGEDDLDLAIRGYFLPGRIQFFVGEDYSSSPDVDENIVADAVAVYASLYGVHNTTAIQTPIYNGVWRGKDGETWPPVLVWNYDIGRWEVHR